MREGSSGTPYADTDSTSCTSSAASSTPVAPPPTMAIDSTSSRASACSTRSLISWLKASAWRRESM